VIFDWHAPVIPYHIDTIGIYFSRRKIPVAWKPDIRLRHRASIHKEFSIAELDPFTLQTHDPFQEHHFTAGKTNHDHIMPRWL
jgi:hypothetical protein